MSFLTRVQAKAKRERGYYQHISRGQSRNDVELNQKPVFINQPYCSNNPKTRHANLGLKRQTCKEKHTKFNMTD